MEIIQDFPTHMAHGEIRLHVHLDLLDEPKENVLQSLKDMGYSPVLCRYTWSTQEQPDQPFTSTCALLFHYTLPGNSEAIFEALNPQWDQLDGLFGDAVTLVRAGGIRGHNFIPPTKRYREAVAA